jgi:hypothetical protein
MAESKCLKNQLFFEVGVRVELMTAQTAIMAAKTAHYWWSLQGVLPLHHLTPRNYDFSMNNLLE